MIPTRWVTRVALVLGIALSGALTPAARSQGRLPLRPGLRPPDESGVFLVSVLWDRHNPQESGLTVEVHEELLSPGNRETARHEAEYLTQALAAQVQKLQGELRRRSEHDLEQVQRLLAQLDRPLPLAVSRATGSRERIRELERRLDNLAREVDELRKGLRRLSESTAAPSVPMPGLRTRD